MGKIKNIQKQREQQAQESPPLRILALTDDSAKRQESFFWEEFYRRAVTILNN